MARKMTEWPSKRGPDYQNHAIGWLHRGYSSLGGGKVVRFPRIWMVYGECRIIFLYTPDLAATSRFWGEVLGLEMVRARKSTT